jgi:hypothetical protein
VNEVRVLLLIYSAEMIKEIGRGLFFFTLVFRVGVTKRGKRREQTNFPQFRLIDAHATKRRRQKTHKHHVFPYSPLSLLLLRIVVITTTTTISQQQQKSNNNFPLPPQLCIALVFLLIDALKFVFHEKTGEIWSLQRRIKTLNNTIGREADEKRKEELRKKEKELLTKRTPLMRKLMSFGHYLSWLKFLISSAFIKNFFGVPLFEVPRVLVWPLGRFLAFPHGNTFEFGQIAVIPWVCLSACVAYN